MAIYQRLTLIDLDKTWEPTLILSHKTLSQGWSPPIVTYWIHGIDRGIYRVQQHFYDINKPYVLAIKACISVAICQNLNPPNLGLNWALTITCQNTQLRLIQGTSITTHQSHGFSRGKQGAMSILWQQESLRCWPWNPTTLYMSVKVWFSWYLPDLSTHSHSPKY